MIPQFIGLCGPKRGGKDTVAKCIMKHHPEFRRVAFADVMKDMAIAMDPCIVVPESLEYDSEEWTAEQLFAVRDLPTSICDDYYHLIYARLADLVATVGWEEAKKVPDVRRFLQRLGTEGGRECLYPDVWVDCTFRRYVAPAINEWEASLRPDYFQNPRDIIPHFVFTDVRFANEIAFIRRHDRGELWRIERPSVEDGDPHPSEREWREATPDRVIENTGSMGELYVAVTRVLESLEATDAPASAAR